MGGHEDLGTYNPERVYVWYRAISRHGFSIDPEQADQDEIDALLNLYYFAPKKAYGITQDGKMVERTRRYLEGDSYEAIIDSEYTQEVATKGIEAVRLGKWAIRAAVLQRVASTVARQLNTLEQAPPGYDMADIFRPEKLRELTLHLRYRYPKLVSEHAGQKEFEALLDMCAIDAALRYGRLEMPGKMCSRVRRYMAGVSCVEMARAESVSLWSVNKSVFDTFPNRAARARSTPDEVWAVRAYYGLGYGLKRLGETPDRIDYLESFRTSVFWGRLDDIEKRILDCLIAPEWPITAETLRLKMACDLDSKEFRRHHIAAVSAFDKFVRSRHRGSRADVA
jgi:hypothetical protein